MLFLLERVSKKQQEEQIDILNLLPGSVFILDKSLKAILYKNTQLNEIDWITTSGNSIDE